MNQCVQDRKFRSSGQGKNAIYNRRISYLNRAKNEDPLDFLTHFKTHQNEYAETLHGTCGLPPDEDLMRRESPIYFGGQNSPEWNEAEDAFRNIISYCPDFYWRLSVCQAISKIPLHLVIKETPNRIPIKDNRPLKERCPWMFMSNMDVEQSLRSLKMKTFVPALIPEKELTHPP